MNVLILFLIMLKSKRIFLRSINKTMASTTPKMAQATVPKEAALGLSHDLPLISAFMAVRAVKYEVVRKNH